MNERISYVVGTSLLSTHAKNNILGLFWKLISCFAFACVNSLVRYVSGGAGAIPEPLPSEVIVCFQNIFAFIFLCPLMLKNRSLNLKTKWPLLHAFRIFIAVVGVISLYYAFAHMPMAQAVALQFTGPVFAVIGAKLYLKEDLGFYRLTGIVLGLIGAFIITRPDLAFIAGNNSKALLMMLPLLSALSFAGVKLLNRELSLKGESAELLTFYLLFFMIPASLLLALANWVVPSFSNILFLALLGALGSLAHYAMAKALSYADITFLTPFGFARIMFTAFLGYIIFAEFPKNNNLWIGFIIIMMSIIFISLGEKNQK
jgi:drug/metabolite transporter (DMT)-like permease